MDSSRDSAALCRWRPTHPTADAEENGKGLPGQRPEALRADQEKKRNESNREVSLADTAESGAQAACIGGQFYRGSRRG